MPPTKKEPPAYPPGGAAARGLCLRDPRAADARLSPPAGSQEERWQLQIVAKGRVTCPKCKSVSRKTVEGLKKHMENCRLVRSLLGRGECVDVALLNQSLLCAATVHLPTLWEAAQVVHGDEIPRHGRPQPPGKTPPPLGRVRASSPLPICLVCSLRRTRPRTSTTAPSKTSCAKS